MKGKIGFEYILLMITVLIFVICCVKGGDLRILEVLDRSINDEILQEKKQIALTFDDGPHPVYTEILLDGLKERGVHATFFLIGESLEGKEEIVKRMSEEGHIIGNHTYTHVQLNLLSMDAACVEIWKTNTALFDITGKIPIFIRPPYGRWNEEAACAIEMQTVLWNIDPEDWKYKDTNRIVEWVVKRAKDGGIILLHDIYRTSVEAALEIVDQLTEQGYEFVTVDELLID